MTLDTQLREVTTRGRGPQWVVPSTLERQQFSMALPFEIWSHIFCQLPNTSPAKLICVSRAWRNVVHATPQLWTDVHICHPRQFADPDGLSLRVKNSGQCPLNVVLRVPLEVHGLGPTLELLHGHARRFRVLDIDVPVPDILDTILLSMAHCGVISKGNPAPLLEELTIDIDEEPISSNTRQLHFERAFYPAPRLWKLTISALRFPLPSSKFISTITALTITAGGDDAPPRVEWMLDTVEAIPRLKSLKYFGYEVYSYQPTSSLDFPRIVRLPNLEVADVTAPGCGLEMLQCLEAPNLRFLRLDGEREMGYREEWIYDGVAEVSPFLRRLPQRAPSIQRLDLHHLQYLQAETYVWLFNQTDFTHLEEVRIEGSNIADSAFVQPSLHSLGLRRIELRDCELITGSGLMAYIEARQLLGNNDLQLLVSGCPGVGGEHLAQLSRWTAEEVND
ncbi:hypothetical protein JB92DRAFT_3118507 [Gautieria morchelliformis]|nr:hypothetical protein JB92DRAFT_3118507 [Gautieria morchelliformis]